MDARTTCLLELGRDADLQSPTRDYQTLLIFQHALIQGLLDGAASRLPPNFQRRDS